MCDVCERAVNSILHKLRDTETPVNRVSAHEHVPLRRLSRGIRCLPPQGHADYAVAQGVRCHQPVCLAKTARRAGSHVPSRQRWPNFFWSDPPPSGHPGEDYNCCCEAVPYIPGETELAFHEFSTGLASSVDRWTDTDFVNHYYFGGGRSVDLLEIGHLREIAEQYAWNDGVQGAFRRLADQIADAARHTESGVFSYDFQAVYDFGSVEFSHGDGVVRGVFNGPVESRGAILRVGGSTEFKFSERFEDPLGLGIEAGGTPYAITGSWSATSSAEVFRDAGRSEYSAMGGG